MTATHPDKPAPFKPTRPRIADIKAYGSARKGLEEWWLQRLISVALVPLTIWFVWSVIAYMGADHATAVEWLSSPINATLMILLVIASFWHTKLGVQVVIEDYVHHEAIKVVSIAALTMACVALAVACTVAVVKVMLGS